MELSIMNINKGFNCSSSTLLSMISNTHKNYYKTKLVYI